jgi:hypothetical protein
VTPYEVELRKERFFFRKRCAYCGACDRLELDSIEPYTWVDESVWELPDYDLNRLLITDVQILCDRCLRRKKQVWKAYKKEGGSWLKPFLKE